MTATAVLFAICSVICLAGALSTIFSRNPIRSAMGLLTTIAGMAGLFLALQAQFLAAIQLIVYAGAVVVLFVFVIMLLGPSVGVAPLGSEPRARWAPWVSAVLFLAVMIFGMVLVGGANTKATAFKPSAPGHGSIETLGALLFSDGIVAFELTTALLIVAVVGAIAVARSVPGKRQVRTSQSATRRFFRGPVHVRDGAQVGGKEST